MKAIFGMVEYIVASLSHDKLCPDQLRDTKVQNFVKFAIFWQFFCSVGATIYTSHGKIWQGKVYLLSHTKFGPDQQRGVGTAAPQFQNVVKTAIFWQFFTPQC